MSAGLTQRRPGVHCCVRCCCYPKKGSHARLQFCHTSPSTSRSYRWDFTLIIPPSICFSIVHAIRIWVNLNHLTVSTAHDDDTALPRPSAATNRFCVVHTAPQSVKDLEFALPVMTDTWTDPWDTPSTSISANLPAAPWDEPPDRTVNLTSNPHASEFPDIFTWDAHDELLGAFRKHLDGGVTYLRGGELGVGGYARVYKVLRQTDSRLFAGKTSAVVRKLVDEANVLREYSHEHLLKYEGWYEEEGKPQATMLVTELCAGGNLHEHINAICRAMEPGQILRVLAQIASAFEYLHDQGLFHSDVKTRNIFMRSFSPMDVVLGDCTDVKSVSYKGELLGTPGFYSPEMFSRKRHCGSADNIWALGVTMLGMMDQWPKVMYTREVGSKRDKRRIERYPGQCREHVRDLERLNPGHGLVKLLGRMLAWTPEERIRAEELMREAEWLMGEWDGRGSLELVLPEGFEQISFW